MMQPSLTRSVSVLICAVLLALPAAAKEGTVDYGRNAGELAWNQGRYNDAAGIFETSLKAVEADPDAKPSAIAEYCVLLGMAYCALGRYADGEAQYKRGLALYEKEHPNSNAVAATLNNLADVYRIQGRYADAEPLCKRAIAMCEATMGENHPSVANCLLNLSALYSRQGRYDDAEPYLKRALIIQGRTLVPEDAKVALTLVGLSEVCEWRKNFVEAEAHLKQALKVYENASSAGHPQRAVLLMHLARISTQMQRLSEAESLLKSAIAIQEKTLANDHPNSLSAFHQLANLYILEGRYADAEPLYKVTREAVESKFGRQGEMDPFARAAQARRFDLLQCLQVVPRATKDSAADEVALLEQLSTNPSANVMTDFADILAERRKVLTADSPEAAEALMQTGLSIETMGGDAGTLFESAFQPLANLARQTLAEHSHHGALPGSTADRPAINRLGGQQPAALYAASSLLCLGNALAAGSDYAKAKEAFGLSEKCFLEQNLLPVEVSIERLLALSDSWNNLGDYARAQQLIAKAKEVAQTASEPAYLAMCVAAEAKLQFEQSDSLEAMRSAIDAGQTVIKSGKIAGGDNALCELYILMAEGCAAVGLYEQSAKLATEGIRLKGISSQMRARCAIQVAHCIAQVQQLTDAKELLTNTKKLWNPNDRFQDPAPFISAARNLGYILEKLGEHEAARLEFSWALGWDKANPSADGLLATARDYNGLALVESALVAANNPDGDSNRARKYALDGSQCIDKYIGSAFPGLSIGQQCSFLGIANQQRDALLTVCQGQNSIGPAYGYMMKWKGLLLESLRKRCAIADAVAESPQLSALHEQLEQNIRLLAALSSNQQNTADGGDIQNRYRQVTAERERLERELSAATGIMLEDRISDMGADSFRQLLKPDEAFVDIVSFKPLTQGNERYVVIVMKAGADGEPVMLDLGPTSDIDKLINQWRIAVMSDNAEVTRDSRRLNPGGAQEKQEFTKLTDRLSDLLITNPQLRSYLGTQTKRVWLCPEGALAAIPWNAVGTLEGKNDIVISQVDSPREFVSLRCETNKKSNKKSEKNDDANAPQQKVLLSGLSKFGDAGLSDLPGAISEVRQLEALAKSLHRKVDYLSDQSATKEAFSNKCTGAAFVHLATHGFAPEETSGGGGITRSARFTSRSDGSVKLATARNPLSECGVYLAPSRRGPGGKNSGRSDNILTADEIVGLDLGRCEIVTLSACQTGLGRRLTGQGSIGLRSSIMAAGARSVLLSLWSVPDDATQELMKRFYTNLWQHNMPKYEALTEAQNYIRNHPQHPGWRAPKCWAAWVLVGD